jgi:hypothetical protein
MMNLYKQRNNDPSSSRRRVSGDDTKVSRRDEHGMKRKEEPKTAFENLIKVMSNSQFESINGSSMKEFLTGLYYCSAGNYGAAPKPSLEPVL